MATVLIVDDDLITRTVLAKVVRGMDHQVIEASDGLEAVQVAAGEPVPDIVLMDVTMPIMDGIEATRQIRSLGVPTVIMVLTADDSTETIQKAVHAGADDYLSKPINQAQISSRLDMALKASGFYRYRHKFASQMKDLSEISVKNGSSMELMAEKNENLLSDLLGTLNLVARMRDNQTYEHTTRVGWLSGLIARRMGEPEDEVLALGLAAPLHDLGKIGIPDSILLKPDKLTDREWDVMKEHTVYGWKILNRFSSSVLKIAATVALSHHERWDGKGYPRGLKGKDIDLAGRIVTVADCFDVIVTPRPYKKSRPISWGFDEIASLAEKQFCPSTVEAFLSLRDEIEPRYRANYEQQEEESIEPERER